MKPLIRQAGRSPGCGMWRVPELILESLAPTVCQASFCSLPCARPIKLALAVRPAQPLWPLWHRLPTEGHWRQFWRKEFKMGTETALVVTSVLAGTGQQLALAFIEGHVCTVLSICWAYTYRGQRCGFFLNGFANRGLHSEQQDWDKVSDFLKGGIGW